MVGRGWDRTGMAPLWSAPLWSAPPWSAQRQRRWADPSAARGGGGTGRGRSAGVAPGGDQGAPGEGGNGDIEADEDQRRVQQ